RLRIRNLARRLSQWLRRRLVSRASYCGRLRAIGRRSLAVQRELLPQALRRRRRGACGRRRRRDERYEQRQRGRKQRVPERSFNSHAVPQSTDPPCRRFRRRGRGRGGIIPRLRQGDAVGREAGAPYSRHHLVAVAAGAGSGLLLSGVAVERMLGATSPVPSAKQDAKILNYALLLEYLQAAFYAEALTRGKLRGELREFAEVVGEHEHAHVAFLKKALGRAARPEPVFHFGHATRDSSAFRSSAR